MTHLKVHVMCKRANLGENVGHKFIDVDQSVYTPKISNVTI